MNERDPEMLGRAQAHLDVWINETIESMRTQCEILYDFARAEIVRELEALRRSVWCDAQITTKDTFDTLRNLIDARIAALRAEPIEVRETAAKDDGSSPAPGTHQIGWLIELRADNAPSVWLGKCGWTSPDFAIRFARERDARDGYALFSRVPSPNVIFTEHIWISPRHSEVAAGRAPERVEEAQAKLPAPASSPFDEAALRAEIVRVWGPAGAHVDLFDTIIAKMNKPEPANENGSRTSPVLATGQAPALSDADVLDRAAKILRDARPAISSLLSSDAKACRAASDKPAPDWIERMVKDWLDGPDVSIAKVIRERLEPVVERLEHVAENTGATWVQLDIERALSLLRGEARP